MGGLAASRRVSTGNQMLRTAFAVSRKQPAPTATPALNPRGSRTSTSSVAQRHLTHIPASFLAAMMFPIRDVTIGRNVATSPRSVGRGLAAVVALHANKIHHLHRCSTPRAPAAALLQHRTPASHSLLTQYSIGALPGSPSLCPFPFLFSPDPQMHFMSDALSSRQAAYVHEAGAKPPCYSLPSANFLPCSSGRH